MVRSITSFKLGWPVCQAGTKAGNSRVSVGFVQDGDLRGLATEGIFLIYPGLTIIHFIGGEGRAVFGEHKAPFTSCVTANAITAATAAAAS